MGQRRSTKGAKVALGKLRGAEREREGERAEEEKAGHVFTARTLRGEAFAARAVGDGVGVGALEAAFLQVIAEVEERAADEERALRIDDDAHPGGFHHDVAI